MAPPSPASSRESMKRISARSRWSLRRKRDRLGFFCLVFLLLFAYNVLYGNRCGKSNKMKNLKTTVSSSVNFKKIAGKKVKKGTYYKFIILALDKSNNVVSASKVIHIAAKGGKTGNPKGLQVKTPKKAKKTIKAGKTFKIKVKQTKAKRTKVKKHTAIRYESSNSKVATVTKAGKVKGVKAGTCKIYVYSQNGSAKMISVKVQ